MERTKLLKLLCDRGGKLAILKTMTDEQLAEVDDIVAMAVEKVRGDHRRPDQNRPVTHEEISQADARGVEKMSEQQRKDAAGEWYDKSGLATRRGAMTRQQLQDLAAGLKPGELQELLQ